MRMLSDHINRYWGVFLYPFSHLSFLEKDPLEEYYGAERREDFDGLIEARNDLRKGLVSYMSTHYHIASYDELYLLLEKWYLKPEWKTGELETRSSFHVIFERLNALSKCLISQRDGRIIYKYWENETDTALLGGFSGDNKIELFHSLNCMMPMDSLAILYFLQNNKSQNELKGFYGNLEVSDMLLDRVLEKGIAENHLHSGVSASFLTIWDDWMRPCTAETISLLKDFSMNTRSDLPQYAIQYYLLLAGLLRATLFQLTCPNTKGLRNTTSIQTLLAGLLPFRKLLTCDFKSMPQETWDQHLASFQDMWDTPSYRSFHDPYIRETLGLPASFPTTDENLVLYTVFQSLFSFTSEEDTMHIAATRTLLLDYLRIKNCAYTWLVQPKQENGLDFFQSLHYDNSASALWLAGSLRAQGKWERAIREQVQNPTMMKIEFKARIDKQEAAFHLLVKHFLEDYRKILRENYCRETEPGRYTPLRPFPRVALVFHLIKQEQNRYPLPCAQAYHLQYGELYHDYRLQVEHLKNLRRKRWGPRQVSLDRYLVGLDVASLENAVPTWVFHDIYEEARDSKHEPLYADSAFQSLGFTFHAGEDFRHLLSGLRRIYEVVYHLKFHAGDRIGHGIALGLDVDLWYQKNQTIIIPRIEALENYLWVHHLLAEYSNALTLPHLSFLENRILRLAAEIYPESKLPLSIPLLKDAYHQLFSQNNPLQKPKCDNCLCLAIRKTYRDLANEDLSKRFGEAELLHSYHCKQYISPMNEPIHYRLESQELDILREVQKIVRNYVGKRGIIIEINPSSNKEISCMDLLSQNQIFQINQNFDDPNNLMVCINSDDPCVFNTNAANEIGYLYFSMMAQGKNRELILQWIEKLRENGMQASFIRRRDSDEQILQELDEILNEM